MTLKFQFSALAQTHPEQKRSLPRLERTLENCTLEKVWPRRTREQKRFLPRLERTLEKVWPRRTREQKLRSPAAA